MSALKGSYVLLGLLCLSSLLAFILVPTGLEGWRAFALNLATEILGILLTVFLIDRVLRRREEREQSKYRSIALRQLRIPLMHHFQFLFDMYKASVEREPEKEITCPEELFDDEYFEHFKYFDLAKPAPILPASRWVDFVDAKSREFKDQLGRVVDKYAVYLDPDTVEVMEQLNNSHFMRYAEVLPTVVADAAHGGYRGPFTYLGGDAPKLIREHARAFCELLDVYNREAPDERKLLVPSVMWSNSQTPLIGSAHVPVPGRPPNVTVGGKVSEAGEQAEPNVG